MTILLLPGCPATGNLSSCGCCGRRFPEKAIRMVLSDGTAFYGEICPECILQGPRGAARRTEVLLVQRESDPVAGPRRASRRGGRKDWGRFMRRKAAALAATASFPAAAKQAALRELRERR